MSISNRSNPEQVRAKISETKKPIVILVHRNPDGDALGAACALYGYINKLGKEAVMISPNAFPDFLKGLPWIENVVIFERKRKLVDELINQAEVIFALDFNDLTRVREFAKLALRSKAFKVLIDHHPEPGNFADYSLSDTRVSSTCELLYFFLKELDQSAWLDKAVATCLYTGIMADTGNFSHNSSRGETFQVVSALLEQNIDKDQIFNQFFNNFTASRMRLMGYSLVDKMVHLPEYNTAYISLTNNELKKFDFSPGDTEGFVNLPLSIKGVRFTALFVERDKVIKISLRSKGDFPANQVASNHFDGGGHLNAAGGESNLNLKDTLTKFIELLPLYKNELQK